MGRPFHKATWKEAKPVLNGHRFDNWEEKARALHEANPRKFSSSALARLFHKNKGTMWWALHPDWRRDARTHDYRVNREKYRQRDAANYLKRKDDPEFRARRAEANRLCRLRKKHNAKMGFIWGNDNEHTMRV